MLNDIDVRSISGSEVCDREGNKIGTAGNVYNDDVTGQPEWVTVKTGFFGTNESFVPLSEARLEGDRLVVPYTKDQVKDSPNFDTDGHLTPDEERRIYEHYSMNYEALDTQTRGGVVGHDTSGPTTDEAMTRSEERLEAGTRTEEAGRARLRKYVTTETETVQVPVTKERATIEREPITEGNVGDALEGPEISEEEHEVVLHEETPVVGKTTKPVERVRLGKKTETRSETVTGDVRKEQIEAEGDVDSGRVRR